VEGASCSLFMNLPTLHLLRFPPTMTGVTKVAIREFHYARWFQSY
jgi:hypothetical protein